MRPLNFSYCEGEVGSQIEKNIYIIRLFVSPHNIFHILLQSKVCITKQTNKNKSIFLNESFPSLEAFIFSGSVSSLYIVYTDFILSSSSFSFLFCCCSYVVLCSTISRPLLGRNICQ